jgi:hypothetical protein
VSDRPDRDRPICDILIDQARRYPRWALEDLYKLVHQAATGSEHAVIDEAHARVWLTRELADLRSGPDEPLLDPISADGSIVRVHLRPFARLGLDSEVLLAAFLRTGKEFRGSTERIEESFSEAARLARGGLLAFGETDVRSLIARMKSVGFPAVHHSAVFEAAYHPAYRVVARAFLPRELLAAVLRPLTEPCGEVSNEGAARGRCFDCAARGSESPQ